MSLPSVSIVVLSHCRVVELSGVLDSVLRQTVKPLETIIVDDTPNDSIKDVYNRFRDVFVAQEINFIYARVDGVQSVSGSRNIGVHKSSGGLIMFLDDDTVLEPDYVEKVLDVFMQHSSALGVQGWITNIVKPIPSFLLQLPKKLFFLNCLVKDSCRLWEYPSILTQIINCEYLAGANMTFKRRVFDEFQFDKSLLKYSYVEDLLLSHSIYKKYPSALFITPFARLVHKSSQVGRLQGSEMEELKDQHRKYVYAKLFGLHGVLLYHWQNIGMQMIRWARKVF